MGQAQAKTDYAAGDPFEAVAQHNLETKIMNQANSFFHSGSALSTGSGAGVVENFQGEKSFFCSDGDISHIISTTTLTLFNVTDGQIETRNLTSDYAAADSIEGYAQIGAFLYILLHDTALTESRVFRFATNDLASGGTLMTHSFFGTNVIFEMTSNGVDLFFTHDSGQDATNDFEISRATISGTTLTEAEVIVCGAVAGFFDSFAADVSNNIFALDFADGSFRKYNSSGTLQSTTTLDADLDALCNNNGLLLYWFDTGSLAHFSRVPI